MRSYTLDQIFIFGEFYNEIRSDTEGTIKVKTMKTAVGAFLEFIKELDLRVTYRASDELRSFVNNLDKDKGTLTENDRTTIQKYLIEIRHTLMAEAKGILLFSLTEKRIDVNKLYSNARNLFPPDIFDKIPEIAKYDFEEGGKCIALSRPTAAAFHLLRGTEAVLKDFYLSIVKRNRLRKPMWGNMVEQLEGRKRNKPPAPLLDHLKNIKDNYRNPTQHPEKRYDIEEVQDLWSVCVDVINQMIRFLKEKNLLAQP